MVCHVHPQAATYIRNIVSHTSAFFLFFKDGGADGLDIPISSSNLAAGIATNNSRSSSSSSSSSTARLRHGPPSVPPSLTSPSFSLKDVDLISPVNERGLSLEGGGKEEDTGGGGGGGGGGGRLKRFFKANSKEPSSSGLSGWPHIK